jgi:putative transcriptional regulator
MNKIKSLRTRLGVTQDALAAALGVSQANVSLYEKGQQVSPRVAQRLIEYARKKGLSISYDDIYGTPSDMQRCEVGQTHDAWHMER